MVFLLCILISSAVGYVLVPYLTDGLSYETFSNIDNYEISDYVQAHRIIQFISQLFVFIAPALLFAYLAYPSPTSYLKLKNPINFKHLLLGAAIMFASIPFIALLEYYNGLIPLTKDMYELENMASKITNAFLNTDNPIYIFFNLIIFVVAAAIGEELLFRGVLQNILISNTFKKQPYIAIIITAILFSLFHGEMSGFIPRMYAGFLLGLAYYFSNSIWVPILMHAINNGMAILLFYTDRASFDNPIGVLDANDLLKILPLTILSIALLFYFFKQKTNYTIDAVETDDDEQHFLTNNYRTDE